MPLRPAHLAVAAATVLAAITSIGAAGAAASSVADQPVTRFVAFQTCQAQMWRWTAENARGGTSVAGFRHAYRARDVWRTGQAWHVQLGGRRGEPVTATNSVAYCVIAGSNAAPVLTHHVFPR